MFSRATCLPARWTTTPLVRTIHATTHRHSGFMYWFPPARAPEPRFLAPQRWSAAPRTARVLCVTPSLMPLCSRTIRRCHFTFVVGGVSRDRGPGHTGLEEDRCQ